jgi:hypothetical protein
LVDTIIKCAKLKISSGANTGHRLVGTYKMESSTCYEYKNLAKFKGDVNNKIILLIKP